MAGGCSGASQHCGSLHGHHRCRRTTDRFQLYPEEGHATECFVLSAKTSPKFSSISAACTWRPIAGRGQPQHQARCSQGCIQLLRLFGEPEGAVTGFKVCATSLVRHSKRLQQLSAALGQICRGQRKPPRETGLALLSCTSIHAVWDELLKMLLQPPMTSNLAYFFFSWGVGKPQDQRQTGTVGLVPWLLLYQHGCSLYLVILKRMLG